MILNGDWKMRVRTMRSNGDNEGAKRELRKAKMVWYDKLEEDSDRFFIDYCLAHHCFKEKDFEMANKYLDMINIIFKDKFSKESMMKEYCNFLWLNVNVNYDKMTTNEVSDTMYFIAKYYSAVKEYSIAVGAIANIYSYKKDGDKLLEKFEEFLECEKIDNYDFIESFLNDCGDISHSLYIQATNLYNKYKYASKINIDVV